MTYFAGLFGECVLAFYHAFVIQLFLSNSDTPIGTATAANFLINLSRNDLQLHQTQLISCFYVYSWVEPWATE